MPLLITLNAKNIIKEKNKVIQIPSIEARPCSSKIEKGKLYQSNKLLSRKKIKVVRKASMLKKSWITFAWHLQPPKVLNKIAQKKK